MNRMFWSKLARIKKTNEYKYFGSYLFIGAAIRLIFSIVLSDKLPTYKLKQRVTLRAIFSYFTPPLQKKRARPLLGL